MITAIPDQNFQICPLLAQQRPHPISALFRVRGGEVRSQVGDGGVRPPEKVRPRRRVEQGGARGREAGSHVESVTSRSVESQFGAKDDLWRM
jgi:hypothetical protein